MREVGVLFDMPVYDGEYVGIEVELENVPRPHTEGSRFWRVTGDGSLRDNGVEFLSDGPLKYKNMQKAMEELSVIFERYPDSRASCRTGLHVHINVSDMTPDQVKAMLLISVLVEPGLIWHCGEDRAGNIYSLASSRGDHILTQMQEILNSTTNDRFCNAVFGTESYKYSALNVGAICSRGTIEYRMHGGTKSVKDIEQWTDMLLGLRRIAWDMGDCSKVLTSLDYIREAICDIGMTPSCITRKSERRAKLLMAPTNRRHSYREEPRRERNANREEMFAELFGGNPAQEVPQHREEVGPEQRRQRSLEFLRALYRNTRIVAPEFEISDEEMENIDNGHWMGELFNTGMRTTVPMRSGIDMTNALTRQIVRVSREIG